MDRPLAGGAEAPAASQHVGGIDIDRQSHLVRGLEAGNGLTDGRAEPVAVRALQLNLKTKVTSQLADRQNRVMRIESYRQRSDLVS